MFEDVERIEKMSYDEYKMTVYYFNHPQEYDGDFIAFRDKVVDYATRVQSRFSGDKLRLKEPEE